MPIINVTLPSDGTTADVGDYNSVVTTMLATINGLLDDDNIASLSGTKITAGTLPNSAISADAKKGWFTGVLAAPSSVTYNGQKAYDVVFNSVDHTDKLTPGMRIRTTRTVAAPTQCTSLNGTTQYWSKSSPNKLTFTDDFTISAWIKLNAYSGSANQVIASRYNGTSGFYLAIATTGQLILYGFNGGAGNNSGVTSLHAIPVGRWVHVVAQLDMSAFTATTTTSYIMFDGIDIPATVTRGGTNPTSLVQAGDLQIGAANSTTFFNGKIAQVAIFNAKVAQSTMLTYQSQGLSGSETSLASGYSFGGVATDLNVTTPNDLTAQASATATNADSPFGVQGDGTVSSTLDYGVITKVAFSTNTTVTVQVPEACTIPTSGGVASIAYAGINVPYGFPAKGPRWTLKTVGRTSGGFNPGDANWYYTQVGSLNLTVPAGNWNLGYEATQDGYTTTQTFCNFFITLSTGTSGESDFEFKHWSTIEVSPAGTRSLRLIAKRDKDISLSAATPYYMIMAGEASLDDLRLNGAQAPIVIAARNLYV